MAKGHGGYRPGSGRKPKAEEVKLAEKMDAYLSPEELWQTISNKIKKEQCKDSIKLWVNYRYGMPKQTVESDVAVSTFNLREAISFDD